MARAIIKCLKLTVTVIGNCITIGWRISISLGINSNSHCLSVRLSTVTVFCTGIILSYPFEITDSLDWVHFWIANNSICCNNPSLDLISKCYFYIIYRSNALYYYIELNSWNVLNPNQETLLLFLMKFRNIQMLQRHWRHSGKMADMMLYAVVQCLELIIGKFIVTVLEIRRINKCIKIKKALY